MAGNPRLKGQTTFVRLLRNGAPTQVLNAISSFEMTDELEVLEEEYLGETEARYDNIYKGTTFTMEIHIEDGAPFDFRQEAIEAAQQRGAAAVRIDIAWVADLPSGATRLLTLIDVKVGPINVSNSARADFVTMKFEGSCSTVSSLNL